MSDILLGINIDHVATLRQQRGTSYPDPVEAARIAERAGADLITAHLREDRRHIQDGDMRRLAEQVTTRLNMEMAITEEMLGIAEALGPADVCLVPERRDELTTEGGLDVLGRRDHVRDACTRLANAGIRVSLFIDPDPAQVDAAHEVGAPVIELHTGAFADAEAASAAAELARIAAAADHAASIGLVVNAGHGLHTGNVAAVAALAPVRELNIGHAIISRAVFSGLAEAVAEMKGLMLEARGGRDS